MNPSPPQKKTKTVSVIEKVIALKVIMSSGLILSRFCSRSNHCCGCMAAAFLSCSEDTVLTRTAQSLALTIFLVQPLRKLLSLEMSVKIDVLFVDKHSTPTHSLHLISYGYYFSHHLLHKTFFPSMSEIVSSRLRLLNIQEPQPGSCLYYQLCVPSCEVGLHK